MSSFLVHPSIRKLFRPTRFRHFRRPWDRVQVAQLPAEYQKFYTEWMDSEEKETPVHWTPKEGKWSRNPETGEVKPIQNEPIQVNYPPEMHGGIWGGEGVVQGLVKKGKWRSPVPRYWSPSLKRNIVYSEVLDKYFSVVVTERALRLIDQLHGLDNYLMMTPAYDLKSLLALKLKRKIMLALLDKDFYHNDPEKQNEVLEKYKEYMLPRNEVEWYGLSVDEAVEKERQLKLMNFKSIPWKVQLRADLVDRLKQERNAISSGEVTEGQGQDQGATWLSKLNPFSKGREAH